MIKLIASDIDGTLVPDGTPNIDPEIFDVIRQLQDRGVVFAGASGRQFVSMKKLFAPVADRMYFITENGPILRDMHQVYSMAAIDRRMLMEMIADAKDLPDCDIMICGKERAYAETEGRMFRWMRDSYKYDIEAIGSFEDNLDDDIVKMSIYHAGNRCEEVVKKWFYGKWKDRLNISAAGLMWMDCILPGVDKGSAVRHLQQMLGISREETMSFGDNLNDLGLIAAAEESYAIGSARDEVKAAAKHVAPPLSENGVTQVLKAYLETL